MSAKKPKFERYYYSEENRRKKVIRQMARVAMLRGLIIKKPCEVCSKKRVEMHHDDYSKPFEVRFLCRKHHLQIHKREAGLLCKDCGLPKEKEKIGKQSRCRKCHNIFCTKYRKP